MQQAISIPGSYPLAPCACAQLRAQLPGKWSLALACRTCAQLWRVRFSNVLLEGSQAPRLRTTSKMPRRQNQVLSNTAPANHTRLQTFLGLRHNGKHTVHNFVHNFRAQLSCTTPRTTANSTICLNAWYPCAEYHEALPRHSAPA